MDLTQTKIVPTAFDWSRMDDYQQRVEFEYYKLVNSNLKVQFFKEKLSSWLWSQNATILYYLRWNDEID